jgi:hypothetical protein
LLAVSFGYVNSTCWVWLPGNELAENINKQSSGGWCFDHQFIHTRSVFTSINLRNSPHCEQNIGVATQEQSLQSANLFEVIFLGSLEDSLS